VSDWLPIDIAPKDGRSIIVYRPNFDGDYIPRVGVDYWSKKLVCWAKSRKDTPPVEWQPMPKHR
jgi:hypothetical protein